jgi:hypothetical protein
MTCKLEREVETLKKEIKTDNELIPKLRIISLNL